MKNTLILTLLLTGILYPNLNAQTYDSGLIAENTVSDSTVVAKDTTLKITSDINLEQLFENNVNYDTKVGVNSESTSLNNTTPTKADGTVQEDQNNQKSDISGNSYRDYLLGKTKNMEKTAEILTSNSTYNDGKTTAHDNTKPHIDERF